MQRIVPVMPDRLNRFGRVAGKRRVAGGLVVRPMLGWRAVTQSV